jgi:hypothetical protein
MKKTLLQVHYEDYIKTMPIKDVLPPSTAASICLLFVGNSDRDSVQQMSSVIEDEYNSAVSDFDLDEFLTKRTTLMYGFEQLTQVFEVQNIYCYDIFKF